jgi:hypothetical protein
MLMSHRAPTARAGAWLMAIALAAPPCAAQTDYYNLDDKRPLLIEDAVPVEFRAFELQFAPMRIERAFNRQYGYSFESEIAYGILPRTQVELGLPIAIADAAGARSGLAGIDARVMHALWTETLGLPGVALTASAQLPVGPLATDEVVGLAGVVVTRTTRIGRVHLDARHGLNATPRAIGNNGEAVRWRAGAAVDHSFALSSTLLGAELVAAQPIGGGRPIAWSTTVGMRRQMAPRWVLDAGLGRRFSGDAKAWTVTAGTSYSFGLPGRAR